MDAVNDIRICISPRQGTITIEEQEGLVTNRKEIDQQSLIGCFKNSLRTEDLGFSSGFLPLNCLSVWQGNEGKRFVLWHPRLYADMTLYDTPYPHFPIPRLVFGFSVNQEGKVSNCRIGVVADETPTPDILSRELTDLNDQFTSLRYLSEELQIRARGLRTQKKAA